ncbi:MAG: hypothetical protein KDA92_23275 [Planctomycetales bacterium]|nr:hypothetical protein [Planctomycetales bacterium]
MRHLFLRFGWLVLISASGCAMCASPYDCTYVSYGGIRERVDMVHGRVGSMYAPAEEINHATHTPAVLEESVPPGDDSSTDDAEATAPDNESPPPTERRSPTHGLPEPPQGTLELPDIDGGVPGDLPNGSDGDALDALPDREAARIDNDWQRNAF